MKRLIYMGTVLYGGLACCLLLACSARVSKTEQGETQSTQEKNPAAQIQPARISPGHCRIIGTLVGVDSTLDVSGPCSKAPCRATIRVDSVLGYGAAFPKPIAVNSQIEVRFAFTVGPTTNELFPNLTERFPGVQLGNKFKTDVEAREAMGAANHGPFYTIYAYELLK